MRRGTGLGAGLAGLLALALPLAAQEPSASVEVRVTESSGGSLFLDRGQDEGIEVGQRVLLYTRRHGILTGTIRGTARKSSTCVLDTGIVGVEPGTRGEVLTSGRRPDDSSTARREATPPSRTPSVEPPPGDLGEFVPLLRPAFSRGAAERPAELVGYTFVRGSYTANRTGGGNEYLQGEAGLDASLLNAVPGGGVFRVRTEYLERIIKLEDGTDTREGELRVDAFSCVWGGRRDQAGRVEAGRFLQHEFSELGVLDGLEGTARAGSHFRFGGSVGAMPDYRHTVDFTGDTQGAVFGRFLSGPREEFSLGLALQKTIHEGEWDRDLLVGVIEASPAPWFYARASAWVDYYTSSELVHSQGFELTEAQANATVRFTPDQHVGVFFSRTRRPDLLRDELAPPGEEPSPEVAEMLRENLSLYTGAYTWHRLSARVVADTRVTYWADQTDETGVSGEVHVGIQDLVFKHGEVGVTAFYTDGIYLEGPGIRLTYAHLAAPVSVMAFYEAAWYEDTTFGEDSLQQLLHLSLDSALSETWAVSVSGDYRFGDVTDSFTLLISLMKRI